MTERRHRGRAIAALAALTALAACQGGPPEEAQVLEGIRRGAIHVLVGRGGADLVLEIEPAHGPDDYAYLVGPDGRTIAKRRLVRGFHGRLTHRLGRPGTYTIIPSPSHVLRILATGARLVHEPEVDFPSLFLSGARTFTFHVPEKTRSFTFAATNQMDWEGAKASVRLERPDGSVAHERAFEPLDQDGILERLGITAEDRRRYASEGDTAVVPGFRLLIDRHTVEEPPPGRWRVVASVSGPRPDDVGFWLEDVVAGDAPDSVGIAAPGWFAPEGEAPFRPAHPPADARVTIRLDRPLGPTGDVGAVWGFTVEEERALDVYRALGLSAGKGFYPQVDMEGRVRGGRFVTENDDDDAERFDWGGFFFSPFAYRLEPYRSQTIPLTMLLAISRPAAWARGNHAEFAEFAEAVVRHHQITLGLDPDGLYWQLLNEPNHDVSLEEYVTGFGTIGRRLRRRLEAEGTPVRFGGPATGNAWSERRALPIEWIEALVREADDVLDFVVWNQYRLGRIHDTWRYAEHVERVDSLLAVLDTDGRREEIVIGATNLRGGIVLQNGLQDGVHSAIWWPSVLCHALGTGRVRLVNYFWLIDQGARRKGFVRADWSRKPVAHATGFVTAHLEKTVIEATSDHDGLAVLATAAIDGGAPSAVGSGVGIVLVNEMPREVRVEIRTEGGAAGADPRVQICDAATGRRTEIDLGESPDASILRVTLPPYHLLGARSGPPPGKGP